MELKWNNFVLIFFQYLLVIVLCDLFFKMVVFYFFCILFVFIYDKDKEYDDLLSYVILFVLVDDSYDDIIFFIFFVNSFVLLMLDYWEDLILNFMDKFLYLEYLNILINLVKFVKDKIEDLLDNFIFIEFYRNKFNCF